MSGNTNQLQKLPTGPLISWYGDDFTGAAAVMEALTFAGLPSILFLDVPDQAQLARCKDLRGIGIASTSRAQSPSWMEKHLPTAFEALDKIGAPIVHYKVCTTLDSSPQTGSIGRAIEIGARTLGVQLIPVLIPAPQMRRYQAFGHLFAAMDDSVYRIDRHPVMAQHPVTPIAESDVAKHLSLQSTDTTFTPVHLETMHQTDFSLSLLEQKGPVQAAVLDCMDAASEEIAGRLIWNHAERFVVGSQGVEYALIRYWQRAGLIKTPPENTSIGRATGMAVVSGSVSETTAAQIKWSAQNGFDCIAFDTHSVIGSEESLNKAIAEATSKSLAALANGRDPLVYTAMGPNDPAVTQFKKALSASGQDVHS